MEELNIVVIGLGSMGKRRTRIVRSLYPKFCVLGVDMSADRRRDFVDEFSLPVFASLAEAMENRKIDAAIISTSPLAHADIANECLRYGLHVFTEINLQSYRYKENIHLAQTNHIQLFLSSTFLYRKETKFIYQKVKAVNEPLSYMYHVGQYLPDWHPWEDYRNYFVAKRESNACRELFAIEMPWLINTFGKIESLQVISDKMSNLDLPYHDNYMVMIKHVSSHKGMLAVDVVSREAVRDFCVYGEHLFIKWDGTPQGLQIKNIDNGERTPIQLYEQETARHDDNYSRNIIENAYESEIEAFVRAIRDGEKPVYGYSDDAETLSWIDKIEEGME